MRKWIIAAILGLGFGFVWFAPDDKVHVVACDVGQGDGILIFQGSNQVLVDGGPNDTVLSCLRQFVPFWDRHVELMVLTNPDADHLTGLIEVLKRYEVGKVVTNNLVKDTARFAAFRQAVINANVAVYGPSQGDQLIVGDLKFELLWPKEKLGDASIWLASADERVLGANTYGEEVNEDSVMMKLTYGDFDVILTGDAGIPTETALVESGEASDVEVLKVGHHGSKYSSGEGFLEAVKPEVALISAGAKNRYGHPTPEAIGRLEAVGARILRTDQDGDIEVVSDGKSYWVK